MSIKCPLHLGPATTELPIVFEPGEEGLDGLLTKIPVGGSSHIMVQVQNTSDRNITVKGKTRIGKVYMVKSICRYSGEEPQVNAVIHCTQYAVGKQECQIDPSSLPSPPSSAETDLDARSNRNRFDKVADDPSEDVGWIPPVDLSHLELQQQEAVCKVLREEADAFARNDEDVGFIENLQLDIQLMCNKPVQKNYVSIPKPLYSEVKEYIQDLIRCNWISRSKPEYSSPMV